VQIFSLDNVMVMENKNAQVRAWDFQKIRTSSADHGALESTTAMSEAETFTHYHSFG
jgi:hypothetical protein